MRHLLSGRDGLALGVGGGDVAHRGAGGDAEHTHEMDGVGGVAGLVEDPVLPQLGGVEAKRPKDQADRQAGDRRAGAHGGGLLADQQVRVGGQRPAPVALA